jgi:hypothetical protein
MREKFSVVMERMVLELQACPALALNMEHPIAKASWHPGRSAGL